MSLLDLAWVRSQFPSLALEVNGRPAAYFDGPGGTQVPRSVIDALGDYLTNANANSHGAFLTSRRTDEVLAEAHRAAADFLGCASREADRHELLDRDLPAGRRVAHPVASRRRVAVRVTAVGRFGCQIGEGEAASAQYPPDAIAVQFGAVGERGAEVVCHPGNFR